MRWWQYLVNAVLTWLIVLWLVAFVRVVTSDVVSPDEWRAYIVGGWCTAISVGYGWQHRAQS